MVSGCVSLRSVLRVMTLLALTMSHAIAPLAASGDDERRDSAAVEHAQARSSLPIEAPRPPLFEGLPLARVCVSFADVAADLGETGWVRTVSLAPGRWGFDLSSASPQGPPG